MFSLNSNQYLWVNLLNFYSLNTDSTKNFNFLKFHFLIKETIWGYLYISNKFNSIYLKGTFNWKLDAIFSEKSPFFTEYHPYKTPEALIFPFNGLSSDNLKKFQFNRENIKSLCKLVKILLYIITLKKIRNRSNKKSNRDACASSKIFCLNIPLFIKRILSRFPEGNILRTLQKNGLFKKKRKENLFIELKTNRNDLSYYKKFKSFYSFSKYIFYNAS